jgi:hypothetical protein
MVLRIAGCWYAGAIFAGTKASSATSLHKTCRFVERHPLVKRGAFYNEGHSTS